VTIGETFRRISVKRRRSFRHQQQQQQEQTAPGAAQRQEATTPAQAALTPAELSRVPGHSSGRALRQAAVLQMQQDYGNASVQRMLVQREGGAEGAEPMGGKGKKKAANPGGKGPGKVKGAKESFYQVNGATLDDISPLLHHFDEEAAQTHTPLGLSGKFQTQKQEDGSYRAEVKWAINDALTELPQWKDYDAACEAAQTEWDRFMGQTRQHEQEAHIDAAQTFIKGLTEADTVITGESTADIQSKLEAKQQELKGRLQAIHDACDHGAAIDAILHPDKGHCGEEAESSMMGGLSEWLAYFSGGFSSEAA
jgi:predicted secreted Zn-dependent protease